MATLTVPVLSNFAVPPRAYGSPPFDLTNPTSTNTSSISTYTFTTDNLGAESVISINGRTVTILKSGNAIITATQSASFGFSTASISTLFTVNVATPTLSNFTIPQKSFSDISFSLTNPTSNSPGAVLFRSLTTDIVTVSGRIVTIKRVGRAKIEATKYPTTNYGSASITSEFDVLTSIVSVGLQNQIDLSWNRPIENGATIKNYFFYVEERLTTVYPAPLVSKIMETIPASSSYYYSYALPNPYYASVLSSSGLSTGIDINAAGSYFNITTSPAFTEKNNIDLGYYGEIEISWVYHNDRPIVELNSTGAVTIMTISLYKEASSIAGDNRIDLLRNIERTYDSNTNCLGPRPQNNNKTMTDIFTIVFDSTAARALKYLKSTDIISGKVKLSSISYSPASATDTTVEYSIILKGIRIIPYRLALTGEFTSLGFGAGIADTGVGFTVSTVNATEPRAPLGVLYHMPRMTRPLTDFNEAKWTFSWNYAANITRLTTDISRIPVTGGLISNLNIPFRLRIRGYSRPYSRVLSAIPIEEYNTTDVANFLSRVSDSRYYTRNLFDIVMDSSASYAQIIAGTTISRTIDISGASNFPAFSTSLDTSHTQFVFLLQLTITDSSYNAYFQSISNTTDAFRVKMLSQTFTPRQEYKFIGPDPTLASSNSLTSPTKTLYNIIDPYTVINSYRRFYNLTNGVYYSYRISSNNRAGTSAFSESFTRRAGSIPNQIVNQVDSNGRNTLVIESEKTTSQVNIYWEKPSFSGYDIEYFVIQMALDTSGQWLTFLDYTPDLSYNTITFNTFEDIIIPVTNPLTVGYSKIINTYKYKSSGDSGLLINGSKYYFRLAGVNELGYSLYSSILTGIPFSRPENTPIEFYGNPIIGDQLIYISWKIPKDDAGSPILNYIVDYEEVVENIQNGVTISTRYVNKRRYLLNPSEPTRSSYPFIDFRDVYSGYKNFSGLSLSEQARLSRLRAELISYVIPPTPITMNDADINQDSTIPSRNVKLSYTQRTFTYISGELNQNVFDINNIQLKWYYVNDPTGSTWTSDTTTVSFGMSIRGHLKDVNGNTVNDINNIFYIADSSNNGVTYNVNRTMFDLSGVRYKYIDFYTGAVIPHYTVSLYPKVFVTVDPAKSRRIDSYNNKRYKLQIDFSMNYISSSINKFILYSGPIIINGTAPVRTTPETNTRFTLKIENNAVSPILNDVKYRFEITPFNMNDFFPDSRNRIEQRIGTSVADPITDMSYSLISTSVGGKVILQWRYSAPSDYQIIIAIPDEYKNGEFPEEYQLFSLAGGKQSIFATNIKPNNGIVNYTIPSDDPDDILNNKIQSYLKSGRGYNISVAPVKLVEIGGETKPFPADTRNISLSGTYIVPFRVPLRPLALTALGDNGFISFKWKLPNIMDDPNYYITVYPNPYKPLPFYSYRFYSIEYRDVTLNSSSSAPWTTVASDIAITSPAVAESETNYTVSGLTNDNNHQFRIRLMIINDYNGQRAFSDYTYVTSINNIAINESSENIIYPSIYPYKPGAPRLRSARRTATSAGSLKGLAVTFDYPSYNGNAGYYECYIQYTPPFGSPGSGTTWYDIFDANPDIGIAFKSDNVAVLDSNLRLRTSLLSVSTFQQFIITCNSNVLGYGIRLRILGRKTGLAEPYPYFLYSDYSNEDFIEI